MNLKKKKIVMREENSKSKNWRKKQTKEFKIMVNNKAMSRTKTIKANSSTGMLLKKWKTKKERMMRMDQKAKRKK